MKDELFEKIAAELSDNADRVKRVHLYRDGEPLLDKKLGKRVSRLKQGGIKKVGISTNAELLSDHKAIGLFEAGLDELILSVDSLKQSIYDQIRVGLNFRIVLDNCLGAIHQRNKLGSKCKIRIRMIRQHLNAEEWADGSYQRFWKQRYSPELDSIEFRNIHNWGNQLDNFIAVAPADVARPCLALWSLCVIFADGTVPLCNVDFNAKFPLGNILHSSIAELWRSAEQNRRRELHLSHNRQVISPCEKCTVWSEEARQAA